MHFSAFLSLHIRKFLVWLGCDLVDGCGHIEKGGKHGFVVRFNGVAHLVSVQPLTREPDPIVEKYFNTMLKQYDKEAEKWSPTELN